MLEVLVNRIASKLRTVGSVRSHRAGSSTTTFGTMSPRPGGTLNFDPIGLKGGMNGYDYVRSIPLRAFDPNGLEAWQGCSDGSVAPVGACPYGPPDPNNCPNKDVACKLLKKRGYNPFGAFGEANSNRKQGNWDDPIYRPLENFFYAASSDVSGVDVFAHQYIVKPLLWLAGKSTPPSLCAFRAGLDGVAKQGWSTGQWKEWCGDCDK